MLLFMRLLSIGPLTLEKGLVNLTSPPQPQHHHAKTSLVISPVEGKEKEEFVYKNDNFTAQIPSLNADFLLSSPTSNSLPVWSNWYFWLLIGLLILLVVGACGYWRRRKIYESSASQTLSHPNGGGLFGTPASSDETLNCGPPLPFLPPAAYPAPPPYSEAARPSFEQIDHRSLYDALLAGHHVYEFYDRRHPNAFYDRYFLPDDTSSSDTTSLISFHLQRPRSGAQVGKYYSMKQHTAMPPPYSEVTSKPELYPVVSLKGGGIVRKNRTGIRLHSKYFPNSSNQSSGMWIPPYPYYANLSSSLSTPDGSQISGKSGSCRQHFQIFGSPGYRVIEYERGYQGTISPATLLASCSGILSPVSSLGRLPSEVSSLAPTSPASPPAPTSPTSNYNEELHTSPICNQELHDVLRKINMLPRSSSPLSTSTLGSDCHSPGGMLSPGSVTPVASPKGVSGRTISSSRDSQTSWLTRSSLSNHDVRSKRHLVASYPSGGDDREDVYSPSLFQPLSLPYNGNRDSFLVSSSASTPNLINYCPFSPGDDSISSALRCQTRINTDDYFKPPRVIIDPPSSSTSSSNSAFMPRLSRSSTLGRRRWWYHQAPIHHL